MARISILLPDLRRGGVERVRLLLAGEFLRRGYDVELVLMRAKGELMADVPPQAEVVDLGAPRFRSLMRPLVGYLRRRQPDAVLAAMWPLTGMAIVARAAAGIKARCVVSEHSNLTRSVAVRGLSDVANRRLGRLLYGAASGVVAVSRGVKDDLVARTGLAPGKVTVIYNPIRTPQADSAADPHIAGWWGVTDVRIISVGALKPAKDFPTLLRAFARLRRTADARLLILGEGPSRSELEALVHELGLAGSVLMPGPVPDPYPYLSQAHLFVLASAWEGLGNVITEALAVGTPVVATDCPSGPAEILEGGRYGRLTPVGDVEALARAMAESLAAPADPQRLKMRGAEFSVERAADQYLALLDPARAGRIAAAVIPR